MRHPIIGFFILFCALTWWSTAAISQTEESIADVSVIGPLSTSSNTFGIPQLQGATLAVSEYNFRNKHKHRRINLKIYDDRSDQEGATKAIVEISQSQSVAAIGPSNSSVASAITQRLKQDNSDLPVISPMATATELTSSSDALRTFFRANVSDRQRLEKLFSTVFDANNDPSNIILIYEDHDSYGEGMHDDALNSLNGKSYPSERIKSFSYSRNISANDAIRLANSIVQNGLGSKTDAIMLFGITKDAISIIRSINKSRIDSFLYFNEPDENEFKSAAEQKVDLQRVKIVSVYYSRNPIVNRFEGSFRARFGSEPSKAAALSYDATNLVLAAVDTAFEKGLNPKKNLSAFREKITNTLNSHDDKNIDFVVPGPHQFDAGEFHNLQFFKLTYDSSGKSKPVELKEDAESKTYKPSPISIIFSSIWLFIALGASVVFASYLGSIIRQFNTKPRASTLRIMFSVTSLIVDPVIAILSLLTAITALFIFKQDVFDSVKTNSLVILSGSAVIGALSGYMGTKLINLVVERIRTVGGRPPADSSPSIS